MYCLYQEVADADRYDMDPTPKASGAPFRFTPSLLDPNSSAFAAFAAQPPGYYTPTPGGSLGFQSYDISVNTQAFNTPDSLTHPNPNSMSAPSIFQPHFTNTDHGPHYLHFRPHPHAQDIYQSMISGSAIGGAASESSSNYSPETASGAETTDPDFYLANHVQTKFMNPGMTRNQDIYGQYYPPKFELRLILQISLCYDTSCRDGNVATLVRYSSHISQQTAGLHCICHR